LGFIEEKCSIYKKHERSDDCAEYNVKTIIVGYGKTGI
jgi:hypothetical protein